MHISWLNKCHDCFQVELNNLLLAVVEQQNKIENKKETATEKHWHEWTTEWNSCDLFWNKSIKHAPNFNSPLFSYLFHHVILWQSIFTIYLFIYLCCFCFYFISYFSHAFYCLSAIFSHSLLLFIYSFHFYCTIKRFIYLVSVYRLAISTYWQFNTKSGNYYPVE